MKKLSDESLLELYEHTQKIEVEQAFKELVWKEMKRRNLKPTASRKKKARINRGNMDLF
ncbi:sporulation histidine kinase inhibitor Sda [Aquibacillus salsiterrae]|uniref:Sporulation histidine kinase inhibitor Sda n=1 Tax=Aquibacillus salsiterrae TaxID=2950439 RepID=A0A9X3WCX6_9BACI|nr:sporulation histidine kinase inhibitor Sda [Aquibacillus salsiterrae]MDC3416653.1 sporulation histidine kinase inhibitor Sda [Aquibacillus salsiterrae]